MIATFVLNTGSPIAVVCRPVARGLAPIIISYNVFGKARWAQKPRSAVRRTAKTMRPDVRLEKAGELYNMLNNGADKACHARGENVHEKSVVGAAACGRGDACVGAGK